ncbi:hypothetical protein BWI97_00075 [Siphonobacter sp. BAB-5405]|uniref:hypothetical protein n=1 Tax=Siphonobacter sp. BAB-5405 TaxID=1864825 RepID=UPI000C7FDB0E|nr:hypothetical protein [Siphonobacter sp. BAB-5405]PMD99391.1 hypothetical protein BWI97_00075 [Siphonobacter sp. BAB-5405]
MKNYLLLLLVLLGFACAKTKPVEAIGGIKPVDIYTRLEKEGYTTLKNIGGKSGNSWTNRKSTDSTEYMIVTMSSDVNTVESVKATATITPGKNIRNTLPFFVLIGTLPYDGADPSGAIRWLETNFDTKKQIETTIGDATFTLLSPSASSRVLRIEKNKALK